MITTSEGIAGGRAGILSTGLFIICLVLMLPVCYAEEMNLVYDANGNLLSGDGYNRTYNSLNQLSEIRNESGTLLETYEYHPLEERVHVKRIYNPDSSIKETTIYVSKTFTKVINSSGIYDFANVYQDGVLVAQVDANGTKKFMHTDHLGSTSVVTNESGNVMENTTYSPFGEILTGGEQSRYDYTGKEYDSVVKDYDFNARKYKAEWGLFTQPDTLIANLYEPQNLNRYSYVLNNPYRYKDTDGKYERDVHYDLTYSLAMEAGFYPDEAKAIALADQSVDEGLTHPWVLSVTDCLLLGSVGFAYGIQSFTHFSSRDRAVNYLTKAIISKDLNQIGKALHIYQDTFSHKDLTWIQHMFKGDAPDITSNDPTKTQIMTQNTYIYLSLANYIIKNDVSESTARSMLNTALKGGGNIKWYSKTDEKGKTTYQYWVGAGRPKDSAYKSIKLK